MLVREKAERGIPEMVEIGGLVPEDHLLRKIDAAVDFNRIYDIVEPLYCEDNGRPSIDPVVLFKMVLIQHLYGLPSLRRTGEEVNLNVAYRWFLGYTLQEETPHFSTVSYNFRHHFTEETIEQVFFWILDEVAEAGYLSPKAVFVDGTHIKANANTKKQVKKEIPVASKRCAKELMEEVNADREIHGKNPFDDDNEPPAPPKKKRDNTSKRKQARLQTALGRKEQINRHRKVDGTVEAHMVAIACSEAPEGRERWTLQLIADELVRLGVVESISPTAVMNTLKKTNLNHGKRRNGVFQKLEQNLQLEWR